MCNYNQLISLLEKIPKGNKIVHKISCHVNPQRTPKKFTNCCGKLKVTTKYDW